MTKKQNTNKKGFLGSCFGCFSSQPLDRDDLTYPASGHDSNDFEYIIENMAIRKAPKKLLDSPTIPRKDFSGYVVKKVPPETMIGPVGHIEDESVDEAVCCQSCEELQETYQRFPLAAPVYDTSDSDHPHFQKPARTFFAETEHLLDESTIQLLTTHPQNDESKKRVLVDVHRPNEDGDVTQYVQIIPPEIKETIDALKVARPPLHLGSKLLPHPHRVLLRSSSNTSCDKETTSSDKRNPVRGKFSNIEKRITDESSLTTNPPDSIAEFNENREGISSDLQSSEKTDSFHVQSLKWKIIINKHKKSNKK